VTPRREAFIRLADYLLQRIEARLATPAGRPSRVEDDLTYAARRIREMRQHALAGPLPDRSVRYPVLTRLIIDQARLSGDLGHLIIELERRYEAL
jgi:hypothetical protein